LQKFIGIEQRQQSYQANRERDKKSVDVKYLPRKQRNRTHFFTPAKMFGKSNVEQRQANEKNSGYVQMKLRIQ
jgi:hypothetical protein